MILIDERYTEHCMQIQCIKDQQKFQIKCQKVERCKFAIGSRLTHHGSCLQNHTRYLQNHSMHSDAMNSQGRLRFPMGGPAFDPTAPKPFTTGNKILRFLLGW